MHSWRFNIKNVFFKPKLIVKEYLELKKSFSYLDIDDLAIPIISYGNLDLKYLKKGETLKNVFQSVYDSIESVMIAPEICLLSEKRGKKALKSVVNPKITNVDKYVDISTFYHDDDPLFLRSAVAILEQKLNLGIPIEFARGIMIKKNLEKNNLYLLSDINHYKNIK